MSVKYRADHIGSFLRPQEILDARNAHVDARLSEVEDRNIRAVLARQAELGFEISTDGEFRRSTFMSDFTDSVEGFALDENSIGYSWKADSSGAAAKTAPHQVTGIVAAKLRQTRRLTATETPFVQANSRTDVKVTLPSPNQFPFIAFKKGVTDKVYADYSALLADVVTILRGEVAALAADGVQYIQIDTPRYSYYIDPKWREWLRTEIGVDPDVALDEAIAADNACFDAARNSGATLALHLCRGNNRGNWYAQGGYDAIAEKLFSGLRVDRFLLEFDDERSGSFEPLRFVPAGKTVVLGLVSTKRAEMERSADLLRRVDEAAKVVPLENLALSPQCGFASVMEGNPVTEETQWAKLKLVADTARQVWGVEGSMADAELTTDIIDYQLDGSADDGDPGTVANPGTYHSSKAAPKGRNAQDGASTAGSDIPKHNEVGGNANAIPGKVGDSARATSFNQVVTKFVIHKQGAYTFLMKLDAQVKTAGQGTVEIRQRANILSATGTAILVDPANPAKGVRPDTALGDSTSTFSGNGTHKVSESGTVPDNLKVTLEKGDYQLELELRLVANAPASDGKSLAEVNDATLSIELK